MYKLSDFYKFLYDNGFEYVCHEESNKQLVAFQTKPWLTRCGSYVSDEDDTDSLEIPYALDFVEVFGYQYEPIKTKTIYEQLVERKLE